MGERQAVESVNRPVTTDRLCEDLRALGVDAGQTLICHSSLSALGWVNGGPPAVVDALMSVVTASGTIVMPTHTTQYSDPTHWSDPPVPASWIDPIKRTRPPYRPPITPSRGMGAVAECFRTYPEVIRSDHPVYSFAAWGADAPAIVGTHPFDDPLGPSSPLGEVYDRDGLVLMLGTDHETNTSLHLAEHLTPIELPRTELTVPIVHEGDRTDITFTGLDVSSHDFADVGAAFEGEHPVEVGPVGTSTSRLLAQRPLVDFAAEWFTRHRSSE